MPLEPRSDDAADPREPSAGAPTPTSRRSSSLARRIVTIPRTLVLFAVVTPALPILLAAALVADAIRAALSKTPWILSRLVLLLETYLLAEVVGLAALFVAWIAAWIASGFGSSRARLIDWTYAIQGAWVGCLFAAVKRIFDLRFDVSGDEQAKPGPILVLIRHTSIADVLLPSVFITRRHGVRLRFVLKRELLQDPCLDVAGNRIPNHFVARSSKESAAEIEAIRDLTRDLGPSEGVLIYPEGTRFTEEKRGALIQRLSNAGEGGGPALARARRFQRVMPPRLGGPLALLDGYSAADVLIVAHRGFEGFATITDVLSGGLVGRTVHVRMWRVPRSSVPASRDDRAAWLDDQWAAVDRWVGLPDDV